MNTKTFRQIVLVLASAAMLACAGAPKEGKAAPPPQAAAPTEVQRVTPGDPFPAGSFNNLNPAGPSTVDLAADIGKRPVVLYYWIAGQGRSEDVFRDLEQLTAEIGSDKIALYGVSVPRRNIATAPEIQKRTQELGLRSPVIEDTGFVIGKRAGVENVPHVTILDAEGKLRLTHGASLVQSVTDGTTLADTIREVADTGELQTHGQLARYFPVKELEGQPSPNFRAPMIADPVERSWHSMIDDDKLNVLVFWSVDCPHCREELPMINDWLRQNPNDKVNVVTCAKAQSKAVQAKTQQFCESNGFVFPTMVDNGRIGTLYRVTTTPTIVIVGPDGVIDTAIISHGDESFAETMARKKSELLETS